MKKGEGKKKWGEGKKKEKEGKKKEEKGKKNMCRGREENILKGPGEGFNNVLTMLLS